MFYCLTKDFVGGRRGKGRELKRERARESGKDRRGKRKRGIRGNEGERERERCVIKYILKVGRLRSNRKENEGNILV